MANEHNVPQAKTPWTKIFSAFKVALEMKKLALAATGILLAWLGWWALSATFYSLRSPTPFIIEDKDEGPGLQAKWDTFKANRASFNLIHELAGSYDEARPMRVDAGDVAANVEEYKLLKAWQDGHERLGDPVIFRDNYLEFPRHKPTRFTITPVGVGDLRRLEGMNLTVGSVGVLTVEKARDKEGKPTEKVQYVFDGLQVIVDGRDLDALKEYLDGSFNVKAIEKKALVNDATRSAYEKFKLFLENPRPKKAGLLRVSPWAENRGDNPYLIVSDAIETRGDSLTRQGRFVSWLVEDEVPVLLEPLVKFLLPIVYLFDNRASGWDRLYLVLMMLWTLAVWGFFGGAICRIAAVQVARNERITLREAILFTKDRYASYLAAPVFPMALLGLLTLLLMIFGWIVWIPWVGDVLAGLLWPIVILIGLAMAIVLVGLVGWPLMIATISTEGTDSFDALSRSYSYLYQKPWQYLWSSFLAVVYGAALVFFIGFMASLMVFLGKWAVSNAVGPANANPQRDREPSYLFYYAPTSFGWRDLLISSNTRFVEPRIVVGYDGRNVKRLEFKQDYELTVANKLGAGLMTLWIYPLFLLVVGFGYSFFWSASTIIYFLMRHNVDDTELDEVHMEDEELDDPFLKPPPAPPTAAASAPPAPPGKPGTMSLNVVEAPIAAPTAYTTSELKLPPSGDVPKPPSESPPAP